jgi:alkylation response protein AidB-like acyl-CoA dehydrogenase
MTDRDNSDGISAETDLLKERFREFINTEVIPQETTLSAGGEQANEAMSSLKTRAKELGLWALGHPQEIGGGGLPFMAFVHMNEVIGRSHYGQSAVGSISMQDSIMLHRYGSQAQQETWLKPLVNGDIYPSVGLTEPEVAGSDPTLMQTKAVLEGDEWVINGHKWFTTGANVAAFTSVFCETEPEQHKHAKFSSIIVPTNTPGYNIKRVVPTMGSTAGGHCEVELNNVRVPKENLLGGRGQGFVIAQKRLGPGRIFHCMRWLGQAQRAFELMCEYAKVRYAHGSILAEKGEIQRYIAESAAEIQAARLMTLDAAQLMDQGDEARVQISLIKFWGARMLHNVIDRAIQVHGALGVTGDTPLEHMYREARFARIYDGPDEVHRMVVARHILKDPVNNTPW